MSPDKTLHLIKKIVDAVVDAGTDVIATPSPLCQTNVEKYQDAINKKFGPNYKIPVVFYSKLTAVVFGMNPYKGGAAPEHDPLGQA
jgi:heterodisulfide reductase subunit B